MYGQTSACYRFLLDQYLIVLRKMREDGFIAMCFPTGMRVVAGAAVMAGGLALAPSALAANLYWDIDGITPAAGGATPSGSWDNLSTNWSLGASGTIATVPTTTGIGDDLTFAAGSTASGYYTVTLIGTQSAGTITIEEGAPTLTGGDLFLAPNATITTTSTVGNIIGGVGPRIASNITGAAAGLTTAGPGTLTLTGANTYAGLTTLSAGTLQIGDGGTTGTLGSADVANTGTLAFNRSDTAYVVSNVVYGAGALNQVGTGKTTLTGGNSYAGITTIYAGELQIGNGGATGTLGSGSVLVDTVLTFNRSDTAYDVSNVIGGAGVLNHIGTGQVSLSGTNSYSGGTNITAGTLQVGNGGTTGSLGTGAVANGSILAFNLSNAAFVAPNAISGTGELRQIGTGITTLSGINTYTGATTVTAGTLKAGVVSVAGVSGAFGNNSAVTLSPGATLDISTFATQIGSLAGTGGLVVLGASELTTGGNNTDTAFAGIISDASAGSNLTKIGSGTQTLSGANTYGGITTIKAGALSVAVIGDGSVAGNLGAASAAALNLVLGGGTLQYTGATASTNRAFTLTDLTTSTIEVTNAVTELTFSAASAASTGGLTKAGAGTLVLSGAHIYSGATTVDAGTLVLDYTGGSDRIKSGNALVLGGGTVRFDNLGGNTQTFGTTDLVLNTSSTLTLGAGWTSGMVDLGTLGSGGGTAALEVSDIVAAPSWIKASGNLNQASLLAGAVTTNSGANLVATDASGNLIEAVGTDYLRNATIPNNAGNDVRIISTGTLGTGDSGTGMVALDTVGTTDFGTLLNAYTAGTSVTVDITNSGANPGNILRMGAVGAIVSAAGSDLLTLGASVAQGGTLTAGGADNMAGSLDFNATNAILVNAAMVNNGAGAVSLTKTGASTLTLAGANTYTGSTTVNQGTLAVGANNALSSSSALTLGGAGTAGTLDMAGFTSAVGSLAFGAAGGTVKMAANQTGSAQLAASGTVALGATNTLDLTGMSNSAGVYKLVSGSSLTGTFGSVTGLDGAYVLKYGTLTANELDAQHKSTVALAVDGAYDGINVRTGTQTIGVQVSNTAPVGSVAATYTLASAGVTGLAGNTRAAGAGFDSSTGTYTAVAGVNAKTVDITNTGVDAWTNAPAGVTVTQSAYDYAQAKYTGGALAFGNVRTGAVVADQTVAFGNQTITNAAYQDTLDVSATTGNAKVTATGFTGLAASGAGATTNNLSLSANTATAGSLASTEALTLTSNANGVSGLSNGTATVVGVPAAITTTGGVYDYAQAKYTGGALAFGNVRTGAVVADKTIAFGNQTITNAAYQDTLDVSATTGNAKVTATGFTGLAASGAGATTNNLSLSANTATAGSLASTEALTLTSNANGVSGLSNGTATVVGVPAAITTTGGVYDYAQAKYTGTTLAFGNIHTGAVVADQTVAFGNQTVTNAAYQDTLDVSATTGNAAVTATGFTGLAASAGGVTTDDLSFAVNTATASDLASTATLTLTSNANGVVGLIDGTATVVGVPTAIATTGQVYSGLMNWTAGTGSWSTNANWTDSTNAGVHVAAGLDAGFTGVDSASFNGGGGTVSLNGANPSLNAITFSNSGDYTLAQGSGGGITMAGTTPTITAAGAQTISAPVILASDTQVAVSGNSDTLAISGDIAESGGARMLTKNGSGLLTLSGNNTYTGATQVNAGTLKVGSATALGNNSAVTVDAASLDATGSTVSTGALALNAGSTLVIDGNTRISATSATVQAGAKVNASVTGFVLGTQTAIITITSGVVTAAAANPLDTSPSQAGYRWVSASDATHIYMGAQWAFLTPVIVNFHNSNPQQYEIAASLDRSSGAVSVNPDIQASYTQLHQPGAPIGQILEHLSGHTRATYDHTTYMQTRERAGDALRLARAPFGTLDGQTVAFADSDSGASRATCLEDLAQQTPEGQQWKLFAYASHTNGRESAQDNGVAKSTSFSNGLTVGASNQLAEDWNVGVALGYDDGSTSSAGGAGTTDIKSYSANIFAAHTLDADKRWVISGEIGASRTDYDSTRYGVGVGGGSATDKTKGMSYNAAIETGYKLDLWENAQLMPLAGLSYMHSSVSASTESLPGAQGLALAYDKSSADSFETVVGVELAQKFKVQDGFFLTPSARVAWHHLLNESNDNAVSTHFVGDPVNSFNTYLQNASTDALSAEVGLTAQFDSNWKVFANVRGYHELGSDGACQVGLGAGVQYSF